MHEILYNLPPDSPVLDLGCQMGSFDAAAFAFATIRVDLRAEAGGPRGAFVQADAAKLPFRSKVFDAVICNHGLEHFKEPGFAMQEIGRVLKRNGALFVSVPDATTFQDRLYRWLTRGGGHVNLFDNPGELARKLTWCSGLPHVATKVLCASFSFLNRRNARGPAPRRLLLLFALRWEFPLSVLTWTLRSLDLRLGTRASIYGWAMYFGNVPEPVVLRPWTNVCVRCGQAHPSEWLEEIGAIRRRWFLFSTYRCPGCGASNSYLRDRG
jgi:SAM-dependent methyltransferase